MIQLIALLNVVLSSGARAEITGPVDPGTEARAEEVAGLPIPEELTIPEGAPRAAEEASVAPVTPELSGRPAASGPDSAGQISEFEDTYGADIARLREWYASACPVRQVSDAVAVTSRTLEETLDLRIAGINARIRAVGSFLADPVGVVRSHMSRAVSESRADLGGANHRLTVLTYRAVDDAEVSRARRSLRLARERTAELEAQLASDEFVRGVADRGSRIASRRLAALVGYSDRYQRLYNAARDCNSVARGNIGGPDGGEGGDGGGAYSSGGR